MTEANDATTTPEITDHEIAEAMVTYGGSFAAKLGETYHRADTVNRARLQVAFPDEWEKYRRLVVLMKRKRKP